MTQSAIPVTGQLGIVVTSVGRAESHGSEVFKNSPVLQR